MQAEVDMVEQEVGAVRAHVTVEDFAVQNVVLGELAHHLLVHPVLMGPRLWIVGYLQWARNSNNTLMSCERKLVFKHTINVKC